MNSGLDEIHEANQRDKRRCTCTGIRFCNLCNDQSYRALWPDMMPISELKQLELGSDIEGVTLIEDFISEEDEAALVEALIADPGWKESQSGRRKIDFGPQVNFKKQKVKLGHFQGLPKYAASFISKVQELQQPVGVSQFEAHEMSVLEYREDAGSNLAFHFDDFWIWGERIYGINLLAPTVLTFMRSGIQVPVPLPRRALYCMRGAARYEWQHGILAEHIKGRRMVVTLRELPQEILSTEIGR